MSSFAEKLHEIRRRSQYTQEMLAQEMNVSRQTISHWENGRAVPDIDTIKRLSHILGYNFLSMEEADADPRTQDAADTRNEPTVGDTPAAAVTAPAETEAAAVTAPADAVSAAPAAAAAHAVTVRGKRRAMPYVILGILLIALAGTALFMIIGAGSKNAAGDSSANSEYTKPLISYPEQEWLDEPVENPYTMFSYDWYNFEQQPVKEQAYLTIDANEDPVRGTPAEDYIDDMDWWLYYLYVTRHGPVDFTLEKVYYNYFDMEKFGGEVFTLDASEGSPFCEGMSSFTQRRTLTMSCGLPMQGLDGAGYAFEGVDSNGNRLIFTTYIRFSKEMR